MFVHSRANAIHALHGGPENKLRSTKRILHPYSTEFLTVLQIFTAWEFTTRINGCGGDHRPTSTHNGNSRNCE
jgi:hypothetical protein